MGTGGGGSSGRGAGSDGDSAPVTMTTGTVKVTTSAPTADESTSIGVLTKVLAAVSATSGLAIGMNAVTEMLAALMLSVMAFAATSGRRSARPSLKRRCASASKASTVELTVNVELTVVPGGDTGGGKEGGGGGGEDDGEGGEKGTGDVGGDDGVVGAD